jgi:hypothetical protein
VSTIQDLDALCPHDGRPIGDHTLREWNDHMGVPTLDLDYEENPDSEIVDVQVEMVVADHVVARAGVQRLGGGGMTAVVPLLVLDFGQGRIGGPPVHQVTVGLLSTPEVMRKIGKILRDTANGAANAAERATA